MYFHPALWKKIIFVISNYETWSLAGGFFEVLFSDATLGHWPSKILRVLASAVLNYLVINSNKIIFTNGCFDVLHIGHIRLLNYCSSFGYVIVGLNSDESVRGIKGLSRPINNQFIRKEFLENLNSVGRVIIFDQPTPRILINEIKPDLIIKGGDYEIREVVGSDEFEVKIFPRVENFSSSALIGKITEVSKNAHGAANSANS